MPAETKAQFWARMRAEGKEEVAKQIWEDVFGREMQKRANVRGAKVKFAERAAMVEMQRKFPPDARAILKVSKLQEKERLLAAYQNKQMNAEVQQEVASLERERLELHAREYSDKITKELEGKRAARDDEWTQIVGWVLDNMHKMLDPENPRTWTIKPKDAPTQRHWNLLVYARTNQKDFMARAFQCLTQLQIEHEKRGGGGGMDLGALMPGDEKPANLKDILED